jgi:hypothetical protein
MNFDRAADDAVSRDVIMVHAQAEAGRMPRAFPRDFRCAASNIAERASIAMPRH